MGNTKEYVYEDVEDKEIKLD